MGRPAPAPRHMQNMLGVKDANVGCSQPKHNKAGTIVSGDDLLSLLSRQRGTSSATPSGGTKISLAALHQESQHEIVALIPNSRLLTINYTNWNRLRSEGSSEEPTLVISFLG